MGRDLEKAVRVRSQGLGGESAYHLTTSCVHRTWGSVRHYGMQLMKGHFAFQESQPWGKSSCSSAKRSKIILWRDQEKKLDRGQAGVTSYAFLCATGSLLRHFSIATPFPSHATWMPATKMISTVSQYCHGNQSQSKLTERTKPVAFKMLDTCPCFQSLLKLSVRPSTNPGTEIFSNDGASEKPELITF